MKILMLHSRYQSGDASGENRVVQDEIHLLTDNGHQVTAWQPSVNPQSGSELIATGARTVWSRRAVAEVKHKIQAETPDVVHCHNLFPSLSPAVIRAARAQRVPVVQTLHNYRLSCLPATFLRDGRVCEDCLGKVPWRGVVYACYRDSRPGSAALATSLTFHRALGSFRRVNLFLAVSRFVRDKHLEAGLPADRIRVKPNFAWSSPRREGPGEYFLYLGRLSKEKGVPTLVTAWKSELGRLLIVGDGPEAGLIRGTSIQGIEFRGAVPFTEVPPLLSRARALVVPSICYEGAPRAIIEAYSAGVPVLASDMGGLSEMVSDGSSGLVLSPSNPSEWTTAMDRLRDDAESERMGEEAWRLWDRHYRPEVGLKDLENAYESALQTV
jgi:glycosyltransferase involved in cell wall biosynthesis